MSLVDKLKNIQQTVKETIVKKELHITRQQMRAEERRLRKEKRREFKERAMMESRPGGSAVIRSLPQLDEEYVH